jgi:hypothetical protein
MVSRHQGGLSEEGRLPMVHIVADSSPEPVQVILNRVKTAIGAVGKNETNQSQHFNFRGIDAVVNAAAPHLNEHGIITVPEVQDFQYDVIEAGARKTPMGHFIVKAKYHFYGPAGDFITAQVLSESFDAGDKGAAKAMSVAYRIALLQVLNLPTTEPDPDSESYERSGKNAETANPARTRKTANSRNSAESVNAPETRSGQDFAVGASSLKSVDALRDVYKAAGAAGLLQAEIAEPGSGEKATLEKYLLKRGDELNFQKSANGASAGGNA